MKKIQECLVPVLEKIEKNIDKGPEFSSGFCDLDAFGFNAYSGLNVISSSIGMGKTTFLTNLCQHATKTKDKKILFVSNTSNEEDIVLSLISAIGRIDSTRLQTSNITESDQDLLIHAAKDINQIKNLFIGEFDLSSFKEFDLVFIDDLDAIDFELHQLIRESIQTPIIVTSSIDDEKISNRPDKRPRVLDLKDQELARKAKTVTFVYRDDFWNPNSELAGQAEIIVAKNNFGPTGCWPLAWTRSLRSFHNLLAQNLKVF